MCWKSTLRQPTKGGLPDFYLPLGADLTHSLPVITTFLHSQLAYNGSEETEFGHDVCKQIIISRTRLLPRVLTNPLLRRSTGIRFFLIIYQRLNSSGMLLLADPSIFICRVNSAYSSLRHGRFCLEPADTTVLRNVGNHLPVNRA